MGDRANICIYHNGQQSVYLYTHWYGERLLFILQNALSHGENWDDMPYLTRTIFCEMLSQETNSLYEHKGFGISSCLGDNEHPIIYVYDDIVNINGKKWTFNKYIEAGKEEIYKVYNDSSE